MDTPSGANAPAPPRGRLMDVPESLSLPRKTVPLGKVAANAVSRRKGYLQRLLPAKAVRWEEYAHFPTKNARPGAANQCIVQKNGICLLQNGGKRAIL